MKGKVKLIEAFKSNFYMLGLAYKASKARVIGQFASRIAQYARVVFYGIIFWEVILNFVENNVEFNKVIPFVVLSCIFGFAQFAYRTYYYNITEPVSNQKMYEKLHIRMFEKATDVELECYENPEFYNKYMKAVTQVKSRAHTVLWVMSSLIVSFLSMIYLVYKTIKIDPFVLAFVIFPIISTHVIGKKINKLNYDLYQLNIMADRKKEYVKRSIYQRDYAQELRLSNGFSLLMFYFKDAVEVVIKNTKEFGVKIGLLSCFSEGLNQVFVTTASILYASIKLLYFKSIDAAEYIVLINAIILITETVVKDTEYIRRICDNHPYIQNIREFFDYEPKISESQKGLSVDKNDILLKLENVSFSYFGYEAKVLNDINLSISKGEKIVLVGENGAGKSTLVKLLMRLYDPTEGQISLNGINIKEYAVKEYRSLFATVFQDYKNFGITVGENVLSRRVSDSDRELVEQSLKESGAYEKIMSLENGIDTLLTREFDPNGAVLSGGENQKIAIARVFAKDSEIAILDEPSSALDPIAEYKMYESMLKACEHKAVIFISHRLSSAVLADKIFLLEQGRIIESGTHDELMKLNGKYAEMFHFQAGNYVGKEGA